MSYGRRFWIGQRRRCFICGGPHLQQDCKQQGKGKGGFKGKGQSRKDGFKGKGKGGQKAGGNGMGKGSFGKKGSAGKKGGCFNCGQLQSQFARAAVEEYGRMVQGGPEQPAAEAAAANIPASALPPQSSGGPNASAPLAPASAGSLVVKHLRAVSWGHSRRGEQGRALADCACWR